MNLTNIVLKLTNTATGKLESFEPIDNTKIKIYVCGPTVYDDPHIGNARALVVYDLLYNLLSKIYKKDSIIFVRNITDIDDKIIIRSKEEGIDWKDLTAKVMKSFHEDCKYLNCSSPTFEPKASEAIPEMLDIIGILVEKQYAYVSNNSVYYDTRKFKEYGQMANKNIQDLMAGARLDQDLNKKNPEDFVLWKSAQEDDEPNFDSKWGKGRPGWHIECSAMSNIFLGEDFDIHGGGADLMFPHHTNEIAQSCAAFPNSTYARYWVHNGFVTVNGEKMSKSLGNFVKIKDIASTGARGEVLRMFLLNCHYRAPMDFSNKGLRDIEQNMNYLYRSLRDFANLSELELTDMPVEFIDYLLNDLNTSAAFAYLLSKANKLNKTRSISDANIVYSCGKLLGIFSSLDEWFTTNLDSQKIEQLIEERMLAKKEKNWLEADRIRKVLEEMGVTLEDKKDGTTSWQAR
ncbi:MAG: cysteine--tRNA ligase [Rickettsiaceae bacterium]|nr:cysteine--tRNA ligase [Rickettsiaceae bacterium]